MSKERIVHYTIGALVIIVLVFVIYMSNNYALTIALSVASAVVLTGTILYVEKYIRMHVNNTYAEHKSSMELADKQLAPWRLINQLDFNDPNYEKLRDGALKNYAAMMSSVV